MALQYSPKIVTDNLVMCLDASQNKSYPTDLPVKGGLLLWLDAADDSTFSYSSGSIVSQWRDKSGLNNHANQSVVGNQPSRSTFNNSRKSVNFVSSGVDYLLVSANSNLALPGDASIFIVYKPATQTTAYAVLIDNYHGQGGAKGFVIQRVATNSQFYYGNGNGSGFVDTSASPWTYTDNVIQLLSLNKASSTGTPYISGTAQTSRTVHANTVQDTTGLAIGTWGLGGREYNGDMCEILIFNRSLSSTEMKQVHTYLGQKWGISNTDRSIIDLSNNNNNGSFGGLPGSQVVADMPLFDVYNKGALKLDGSTDYIAVENATSLNPTTVTVSIWIKRNGYQSSVASYLRRNYNDAYGILGDIAADNVRFRIHNGSAYPESPNATLSLNEWTNIVGTYDLANIKIYKNGVFVGQTAHTSAISYASANTTLTIGRDDPIAGRYMNANYGSVLIYSRALSAVEVAQNYEAQKSKFANTIVQQGLVLNLDAGNPYSYAGAGSDWFDVSGNNYSGSLTNGPVYSNTNGGVFIFDGSNDYVVTSNFTPNFSTKTLSGWVKLSSISQQGGGLITLQSTDGTVFDSIVYNETGQGWGFGSNGFSRTGWSGVLETSTSDWVNITATYENSNYRLYRNGVLIQTLTSFGALNFNFNSNVQLGYRHLGSSGYLSATIAQGIIYNRVLSASEVLQNYNATKGRFGL
jgi:hypothetical protein